MELVSFLTITNYKQLCFIKFLSYFLLHHLPIKLINVPIKNYFVENCFFQNAGTKFFDIKDQPDAPVESLDKCIAECERLEYCKHVTYIASEGLCTLKKFYAKTYRQPTQGTVFVGKGCNLHDYGNLH